MTPAHPPLHWRSACGTYSVRIKMPAYRAMKKLAEKHSPVEVGTSLVGAYTYNGTLAIVHGLAPLTPDSRGWRTSFVRGITGLHTFFTRVYRRFCGKRHYVGEWHSHPHAAPSPSPTDDRNQTDIANDQSAECPECILVIIGGDLTHVPDLSVFVYSRTHGRIDLESAD